MPTQRTVLFLGAGASRALGYPVTSEILPRIVSKLKDRTLFPTLNVIYPLVGDPGPVNSAGFLPDAMAVFETELTSLFPGILLESNPPQITEVLSLLDHLIVTGTSAMPRFPRERLTRLRALLERAVATVVTEPDDKRDPVYHSLVDRFVGWIAASAAAGGPPQHVITVITTNYDLAIEKPLTAAVPATAIDYGFSWRDPFALEETEEGIRLRPADARIAFFKLHGSINWLRCPLCEHVYLNGHGPIFHQAFASRMREENTCTCYHWPLGTLLVAPSMIRDIRDPNLLSIWQSALEAMRRADRWVVVGYSLPPEDLAIRSLFLRASRARTAPPVVEIYEHGIKPEVESRYRLLIPAVMYNGGGFEAFIGGLQAAPAGGV
jgi:hypothetical protein